MPHLQCVVFIQPNDTSIQALCQELQRPKYGAYWLCTYAMPSDMVDSSNVISKQHMEALAEADQHQVVQAVQVCA